MKYFYCSIALVILMACNLSSPTGSITPPPPIAVNETLSVTPIDGLSDDGRLIVTPQSTVTVSWDGLPAGTSATFILGDFLSDGGVMEIGQGTSATFTVPDRLNGELSAFANLPDGTTINALTLPVVTANMITGNCQYLPPALGPGVTLYSEPTLTANTIGSVIYNADYNLLAVQDGLDDKGASIPFYQIQQVGAEVIGWVQSNVGENLAGDCSAFQ